jgi:hypothetical protein
MDLEFKLKWLIERYKKYKPTESLGVKGEPQRNTGSTLWPSIFFSGALCGQKIIFTGKP